MNNNVNLAWGMPYQSCIEACISIALAEGREIDAATFREFPVPSDEEWAECVQEVANESSQDLSNPYHCMGQYELRLDRRGVSTPLGRATSQMNTELEALALKAGIPNEFVPDAIKLFAMLKIQELSSAPRDKGQDN
jgi:hypothetical protein